MALDCCQILGVSLRDKLALIECLHHVVELRSMGYPRGWVVVVRSVVVLVEGIQELAEDVDAVVVGVGVGVVDVWALGAEVVGVEVVVVEVVGVVVVDVGVVEVEVVDVVVEVELVVAEVVVDGVVEHLVVLVEVVVVLVVGMMVVQVECKLEACKQEKLECIVDVLVDKLELQVVDMMA